MPDWSKLIAAKVALAKRAKTSKEKSPKPAKSQFFVDPARVPPGQTLVNNFPILDTGYQPDVPLAVWSLRVFGLVENPITLNWHEFLVLPQIHDISDFHCVTRWSQLDMEWQGVQVQELLMRAKLKQNANFATIYGFDGYTTNLPIEALLDDDVLIAHSVHGKPLTREHGGPARMVVPKRYAWKGAKWVKAIELHEADRPGFWEVRGYHNEAFPFEEQRFSED
jgi:DMSO/TMAO reductase YedYZ molybdopterin-dependent catalytic subunit